MPLVNISILKGKSPEYIKAVADGINSAVIETMGFPWMTATRSSTNSTRNACNCRNGRGIA